MPGKVNVGKAELLHNQRLATEKHNRVSEEMSTGKSLLKPGDDVASFGELAQLGIDKATEIAQMRADQDRLNWFESGVAFLQEITDILGSMSTLAIRASSSDASVGDSEVLDANFQTFKNQISSIVDGLSGQQNPRASMRGIPLFIGFSPELEVGSHVNNSTVGEEDVNLFTGMGRQGFNTIPLLSSAGTAHATPVSVTLTGTATGGSTTTLTLDTAASSMDDVYIGMQLTVTGGTGSGQTATISDYDGATGTVTFSSALATALDNTSQYSIAAPDTNSALHGASAFTSVSVASHVWGADNHIADRLTSTEGTFQAITGAERSYRVANSIPNTTLEPQTHEEKEARRKLNIFDEEFGNLKTQENASRMLGQVKHAIAKVTVYMQRLSAKSNTLRQGYEASIQRRDHQENAEQILSEANIPKAAAEYRDLAVNASTITDLGRRLANNIARLNDLIGSRRR